MNAALPGPEPAGAAGLRWSQRLGIAGRPLLTEGNRIALLAGGAQYFPRLLDAIEGARRTVHLETYIFAADAVGARVADALARAAARGVEVRLVVDGYGGGDEAREFAQRLSGQGVEVRIYRPQRWWHLERRLLRRLHRKIAVVDDGIAFVGGINVIDDLNHGDVDEAQRATLGARFDFAVACEGPIVEAVGHAARRLWWTMSVTDLGGLSAPGPAGRLRPPRFDEQPRCPARPGGVRAALLLRDNLRNRRTIERAYLDAIAAARREILIANAYFLPGRRFRAALAQAARRGVQVRLLLQGRVEYPVQYRAQRALYGELLAAGVQIHTYVPAFLHAKAAVVDDDWATVGSSNIDPYSLLLAREANVIVRDAGFAAALRAVLDAAIARDATRIRLQDEARRGWLRRGVDLAALVFVRWAVWLLASGKDY